MISDETCNDFAIKIEKYAVPKPYLTLQFS